MGSAEGHRALLLGLVEVLRPVKPLDDDVRAEVFAMCHTASTTGQVEDPSWLGWVERGFMGVEVMVDQHHLHITSDEVLISRHNLAEVCDIRTVQGTEGHLVVVGRCMVKGLLLAVVLDMMAEGDARQLEDDVRHRLSQLVPLPARPSTPQDTKSVAVVSEASTFKPDSKPEQDPSTSHSRIPGRSDSQHTYGTSVHASASLARPGALAFGVGVRPAFHNKCLTEPPPLLAKTVLSKAPDAFVPPCGKPPGPGMPSTLTLAANPLHLTSRSSVSLVATRPVSTSRASISAAASQPAVASSVSSLLASTPSVSTRPVSFPKKINWQHVTSASNPTMSTRPGSTPMVFSRPASTAVVSSRSASTAAVSSRLGSTAAVSTRPMSTAAVFTRPMSTAEVSIAAVSSRFVPTATRPTQPISSPKVSSGLVSTPLVSTARACTPIVSTPKVTARPMPTVTMSCRTVSIPDVSTRPLSFTKTFTPLVSSVSTQPVSSTMVRSMVTGQDTRPVSTPTVSIQPISIPKVITPLMSVPRVSGTTKSISMSPTTSVSASTVSTNPVPPSTVPITLVSAPVVTSLSKSLSSSVLSLFTRSSPGQNNQSSKVSSGSQEKESNSNDKVDIILEAPKGEESEQLYIYSADLQPPLRKDSSASLEHELCSFLENEHQYLNTLKRINDAKKVLTSELQNLLIGSDRLADFHNDLYRNLYQEFPSSSGIAQVFLSSKEELDQYRYYIMNAPQVASQLGQQTEIVQQHPDLEADIKSSWKRLHFYFMTFEKLVKIVPPEEQQLVQKVVDLLRETNRQGDSGILIDAVKGAPFNLHTLGPVVLHNLFHIKDSSGMLSSRMKYHVLLFEEMLVILLPKKEKYRYRDHLLLRQLNLLPQSNSDEATFVLELEQGAKKRKRKYTFRPRQQEAKAVWVAEFSRLLLKYEEEVERLRQLRWGNT